MASRTSRKEWVRGLPSAFGVGRYGCKRIHWASERSVGYVFLMGDSVRNHPNPHPYQTGSKELPFLKIFASRRTCEWVICGPAYYPFFNGGVVKPAASSTTLRRL